MAYSWTDVSAEYQSASDDTYAGSSDLSPSQIKTANPRKANVLPSVLSPRRTYQFRVVASMLANAEINNTAVVEVVVNEQPLVALIAGGSRLVGTMLPLVVDASPTYDPDEEAGTPWLFEWSCASATTGRACGNEVRHDAGIA